MVTRIDLPRRLCPGLDPPLLGDHRDGYNEKRTNPAGVDLYR